MRTVYELKAEARCPVDGEIIAYDITITVTRGDGIAAIPVEEIIPAVRALTGVPVMQEPFTADLARHLRHRQPSVEVVTVGTHSGVKITCRA